MNQHAIGAKTTGLKKHIADWAKAQGTKKSECMQYGHDNGGSGDGSGDPLTYRIAHKLVLSKIADALGLDQAKLLITSAAPISVDVSLSIMHSRQPLFLDLLYI